MGDKTDEERARPPMWRFWRALPPKGRSACSSVRGIPHPSYSASWAKGGFRIRSVHSEINRFEKMLTNEGALIIKFCFIFPKRSNINASRPGEKPQDALARHRSGLGTLQAIRQIPQGFRARVARHQHGRSSWIVVEGSDARYRNLTTGKILLEAIHKRLNHPTQAAPANVARYKSDRQLERVR